MANKIIHRPQLEKKWSYGHQIKLYMNILRFYKKLKFLNQSFHDDFLFVGFSILF
jgi:hypothetical protein